VRPTPHRHFARAPSPARPGGGPPARPSARTTADFTRRLRPIGALPEFLRSSESDVDVVIPVHNEEGILATSVRRLHRFLSEELPFSWRIIIADNASTDRTPLIATRLSDEMTGVQWLRLEAKGRGRALRAAWSGSEARVVCYMDADLSTELTGLLPLLAPLLSGHSALAIGTPLARDARVVRGFKREFISRSYNLLLRISLRAKFSDAQCGFKAVRGDVLDVLLAAVRDEEWFFDTELLIVAQRRGLRIHEVPVDWRENAESSVDIIATALADLRGIARVTFARALGTSLAPAGHRLSVITRPEIEQR
jgi:glycosyltransferase involved in cell wall biosynthesis